MLHKEYIFLSEWVGEWEEKPEDALINIMLTTTPLIKYNLSG